MDEVTALEINEPIHATMESLEIMLACGGSIIKADINASKAQEISAGLCHGAIECFPNYYNLRKPLPHAGKPMMLKVSPSGQFLAVITTTGACSIYSLKDAESPA